mgnify:CR=1 FL=1
MGHASPRITALNCTGFEDSVLNSENLLRLRGLNTMFRLEIKKCA